MALHSGEVLQKQTDSSIEVPDEMEYSNRPRNSLALFDDLDPMIRSI